MTTLTVLAIASLILGRGQGAEFGQRMGIVMLGGILFSAILTFLVVPAAFYLFERRRAAKAEEQRDQDEDRVAIAAGES
jgi:HAE1 family hydrophobic/amphiphilic exporter-1